MATDDGHAPQNSSHKSDTARGSNDRQREAWMRRLLPLMSRMVVGLTIFFFIASALQLAYLHYEIRNAPPSNFSLPDKLLEQASATKMTPSDSQGLPAAAIATLTTLERTAMERRYHQANVLLMSRVWTSYLGFVTGMVLAMVGAVFILGRLEIATSSASVKAAGNEFNVRSTSPGLFMVGFGVALMITTIVTHHEIGVEDRAIYTTGMALTAPPAANGIKKPPPPPFTEAGDAAGKEGVAAPPMFKDIMKSPQDATPEDTALPCSDGCSSQETTP